MGKRMVRGGDRPELHREMGPRSIVDDRVLMDRIHDGDREAFRTLLQRYWRPLVGFAAQVVGREDDGEDVVQETFVRVWRHRTEWTTGHEVAGYLYRITRNLALNWKRDRGAEEKREMEGEGELYGGAGPRTPEHEFVTRALRAEVDSAVASLPERRREIFVLSRYHGLTHEEIAGVLGLSPQTVANHMTSALADLRKALAHSLELD